MQFLSLLRLGIGKESEEPLQGSVNWDAVEILVVKQGLLAYRKAVVEHAIFAGGLFGQRRMCRKRDKQKK